MSLFEWFGEKFNPGPVGTAGHDDDNSWQPQNKFLIWLLTLLGAGIFGFFVWGILQLEDQWQWVLVLVVYLFLARLFTPKLDHSNMGWVGGIINHPFRISDDLNRWLFFFALFLLPGKLVLYAAQTIINTIRAQ